MKRLKALVNDWGYSLYPILLAFFPLLSFYASNVDEIKTGDFKFASFAIFNLIVLAVIWLVASFALLDAKKASILTTVTLTIFFTLGRVDDKIQNFVIHWPVTLGAAKLLLLASGLILLASWLIIRRLSQKMTNTINLALTVVAIYLVLSSLFSIAISKFSGGSSNRQQSTQAVIASSNSSSQIPDIYYILLDAYARADILKNNFNFDNSGFVNDLKKRGFYVADKAHSNYAHTHWSVPSTLNMDYLNYLTAQQGETSSDRTPLKNLTMRSKAALTFKSLGYKYVNIPTLDGLTKSSPLADIDIKSDYESNLKILNVKLDEFALVYLQTTALKPWIAAKIKNSLVATTLGAFEKTAKVSQIDEPTLTFTHVTSPHPPYLFNRSGPIPGLTEKLALDNPGFSNRQGFVDQTVYINKLTLDTIDTILKNSKQPPIIIVASDHGPASTLSQADFNQTDPSKFNVKGIRERMATLNAYLFPDKNYKQLYPTITPVNSFRLILNQYFHQNIKLLEDKSYFSRNKGEEYRLFDVTKLVN